MIFDGRWKWELQKLSWAISVWRRLPAFSSFAEHQLNRAILYSATILRKVIEDEAEAETVAQEVELRMLKENFRMPDFELLHATLSAIKFPHQKEQNETIRGKLYVSDYNNGQSVVLRVKNVCNWLIHSCVWSLAQTVAGSGYSGFLVSSDFDREKHIHFVSFSEWQRLIKLSIAHGAF